MLSAAMRINSRPTSVEPVKATLSTSGLRTSASPMHRTRSRHDVDDAIGDARLQADLRQRERRQWRLARGLEHDGAASGERGSQLPRRHHDGKFQGMIWLATPTGSRKCQVPAGADGLVRLAEDLVAAPA